MKKIISMICVLAIMISVGACSKKPKEIELKKEEITLNVGDEEKLKNTLSPAEAEVEWESSDKKVAEVSNDGIATAIAAGACTITVTWTYHPDNGLEVIYEFSR